MGQKTLPVGGGICLHVILRNRSGYSATILIVSGYDYNWWPGLPGTSNAFDSVSCEDILWHSKDALSDCPQKRRQKNCPTTEKYEWFLSKIKAWPSRCGVRHETDSFIPGKVIMPKISTKDVGTKRKDVCHEESQDQN